jgi:hypothetical protein
MANANDEEAEPEQQGVVAERARNGKRDAASPPSPRASPAE